jgi:hypothetical protein
MKQLLRYFTIVFLLVLSACSKKVTDPETGPPGGKDSTKPIEPTPIVNCTGNSSDILNMMIFPADNAWNKDISASDVDPASSQILAPYSTTGLKADFGSGLWDNAPIGIPFVVVCGTQQKLPIVFRSNATDGNYGDESDPGPYPIPLNAPVEGNGQEMHMCW